MPSEFRTASSGENDERWTTKRTNGSSALQRAAISTLIKRTRSTGDPHADPLKLNVKYVQCRDDAQKLFEYFGQWPASKSLFSVPALRLSKQPEKFSLVDKKL